MLLIDGILILSRLADRKMKLLHGIASYALMAVLFSAVAVPVIVGERQLTFYSADEVYHIAAVHQFHDQWPRPDLRDYPSPETPLYYLMLAACSQFSENLVWLRLVSFTMSLVGLLVIQAYLTSRARAPVAFLYTACMVVSPYFLGAAVRLRTENPALCAAIAAIWSLDYACDFRARRAICAATLGTVTVLMRQVYAWLAPAQVLATFLNSRIGIAQRFVSIGLSTLTVMPLIGFIAIWHGFTPPSFTGQNQARWLVNVEVPILVFALLGALGSVFALTMHRAWSSSRCRVRYAALVAAAGLVTLLIHPINLVPSASVQGGWLFDLARLTPEILGSSLTFWTLFPLGLIYLYVLITQQAASRSYFMTAAMILWVAANAVSSRNYQRYYEPMLLFIVGYTLAPLDFESWVEWALPAIFVSGYFAVDLVRFYGL